MEEPFKPLSLSVRQLFGNDDALYKIPQYQRPYKWEDEQVERLWDDIHEAFTNEESNYFLGSIITAKPRGSEQSAYVDVVDGQQRLTTLMILFCVVRDMYPDINHEAVKENPNAVDMDTINSSISRHGKAERLRLFTHAHHNAEFQKLILNGNTIELEKPYKYQIRTDEEPKYKFMNTAAIFKEKLSELGDAEVAPLVNFLFNQVNLIRIDCANREFAIRLFQVLNDRGMDLTAADLIKSFLMEKLYRDHTGDKDGLSQKEEQFIADWREAESHVKDLDINLNDLLIMYEYHLLGENPKRSLYEELQTLFMQADPNAVIADFKDFAEHYHKRVYYSESKITFGFWYLRWSMYWKSIALTAYHSNYPDVESLLTALRRFYYLNWIAGKTLSAIKQSSFNVIKAIKEKKPTSAIVSDLENKLKEGGIVQRAVESLRSQQVDGEPWIKPLLILLEYESTDASKSSYIELKHDLHLEHIIPIKHKNYDEWNQIDQELAARWLRSAANLTLLSGEKNIEASDSPFRVKINVYRGKGKYEQKSDKVTAFQITQRIVNDFDQDKYGGQWNEEAIIDRWKWFCDEVGKLFNVDTSELVKLPSGEEMVA
jgi:uncharacterized protein with ParB-like and HNH nuclease domain